MPSSKISATNYQACLAQAIEFVREHSSVSEVLIVGATTGAAAEVVDLDRLKDQFIRIAAHELKTPAAILKGYALTLMRTDESLSPRPVPMAVPP